MLFVFAPIHIIMIGPKATFGSEFKTVKYGSNIFDMILKLYRIIDNKIIRILRVLTTYQDICLEL